MKPEDLDRIRYLPIIRSRQAELKGYRELKPATKQAIVPLISLGKRGRIDDPDRILGAVADAVEGPFFLDLNPNPGQHCAGYEALCNEDGAYAAWRQLVAKHPAAIPVAMLREGAIERPFVQQALKLEKERGLVVIRSRRPSHDLGALQAVMSAIDDVNNLLIILDFGYIRGSAELRESEATRLISSLRSIDVSVRIVIAASSFPKAVSAYGDTGGRLEIVERDFHWHIGGDEVAIYGDHAAIYPLPVEPTMSRWVPRIDYCLPNYWLFRRHRADDGGFAKSAREIVESPDWQEQFAAQSWGADVIRQTAAAGDTLEGFGSPASWIAARVNMHIERQSAFAFVDPEEEYDFG